MIIYICIKIHYFYSLINFGFYFPCAWKKTNLLVFRLNSFRLFAIRMLNAIQNSRQFHSLMKYEVWNCFLFDFWSLCWGEQNNWGKLIQKNHRLAPAQIWQMSEILGRKTYIKWNRHKNVAFAHFYLTIKTANYIWVKHTILYSMLVFFSLKSVKHCLKYCFPRSNHNHVLPNVKIIQTQNEVVLST
jgi:hypothetical protein